jgi:hypothetical protein
MSSLGTRRAVVLDEGARFDRTHNKKFNDDVQGDLVLDSISAGGHPISL